MSGYHMKRVDRTIGEAKTIRDILARRRLATIALCREGEPYIVTMNYGYDEEGNALYFHCAAEGLKLDFIAANPSACVSIVEDLGYVEGKCDHRYRSIVIRGKASLVGELEEKKRGINVLMEHQESDPDPVRQRNFRSDADYGGFEIIRIDIGEVTGKESV